MKNRGFILTLDAAIAAFTVLTILAYINVITNESEVTQWSESRMLARGYDVTAMLENTGALAGGSQAEIEDAVNEVLSPNYGFRLEVTSYVDAGGALALNDSYSVGPEVAESELVTHGTQTFLTLANGSVESFNAAEFWIWFK